MKTLLWLLCLSMPLAAQVQLGSGVQLGGAGSGTLGASVFSTDKATGTLNYASSKTLSVAAGATADLLPTVTGSGYVQEVFFAAFHYYSTAEIIVTVDGEVTPSIDMNAIDLFGNHYYYCSTSPYCNYSTQWLSSVGTSSSTGGTGGGAFRLPIPFSSSVHIQVKNNGAGAMPVAYEIAYQTGVSDNFVLTQHLYATTVALSGVTADTESTLLNVSPGKAGRLAGISWIYDSVPGSASPATAPLEGYFRFYVDGSGTPSFMSSGAEDLFGMAFYFAGATQPGQIVPQISDAYLFYDNSVTWGAARFFIRDPIPFTTGLKVTWQCGVTSVQSFTGTCSEYATVYYYTVN